MDEIIGITQFVGVLAALYFGVQAERRIHTELDRQNADERRSQAAQVWAWLDQASDTEHVRVRIHNGSDRPVYDVALHPIAGIEQETLPVGIVGPMRDWTHDGDESIGDPGTMPYDLAFTDANGRKWRRRPDGTLFEV